MQASGFLRQLPYVAVWHAGSHLACWLAVVSGTLSHKQYCPMSVEIALPVTVTKGSYRTWMYPKFPVFVDPQEYAGVILSVYTKLNYSLN